MNRKLFISAFWDITERMWVFSAHLGNTAANWTFYTKNKSKVRGKILLFY